MTFATERAVFLRYTRDGGQRRGSGLRIGGTLVLTADHCANGTDHTVVVDGRDYPATVAWRSGRAEVDLAVLTVPGLPALPWMSCARVNTGIAANINDCVALGFPAWNDRKMTKHRAQADGIVPTGEGANPYAAVGTPQWLTFKITTPAIRDKPVESGDLDKETTPWGGMSGAVLVTQGEKILGVVRGHAPAAGVGSLTFTPLAAIDALPAQKAAKFWALLGVANPHALPVLPVPEVAVSDVIVVGRIPARPPGFVHRSIGDRLAALLDDATVAVVCTLTGMRGVGKTHIAAAYARSWIHTGQGLVGWVNAETVEAAVTDLTRIAEAVGAADLGGDSITSAHRLVEHLATRPGKSLLVFDNATDPDGLREYLPLLGQSRVIITSTDTAFIEFGDVLDVEQFDRLESLRYLRERTRLNDATSADLLARDLGDLPLALAAATATIRQRHYRSYARYLEQLRTYPVEEVLRRPAGQDYQGSTAAALLLSIDSLAQDDPAGVAGRLTGIMSVLSLDGVRKDLLDTWKISGNRAADLQAVDDAIERCTRHSVLSWSALDEALIMHPLTARVLRERAAKSRLLQEVVTDALDLLEPHLFDESQAWGRRDFGTHLVTHIEALWKIAGREQNTDIAVRSVITRSWAVRQLWAAADVTRAVDLGRRVLADTERVLGAEHPHTLTLRNNLASSYQSVGRLNEAIPLFERTLADTERVLGAEHPHTLTLRNNLASAYEAAKRFQEAIRLFERVLADRERILGAEHPDVLAAGNNLAGAYGWAGRFDKAIPLFERVLTDAERILGTKHSTTLTSRNNLAYVYTSVGRLDEAIPLFERVLADRERILGAEHPDVLAARNNLAGAYESAGHPEEAIPLYERALAGAEQVLDPDHPQILTLRNNLAYAYWSVGSSEKAIPLFERVLTDAERILGTKHSTTLTSRNNLAYAYQSVGRVQEGMALLKQEPRR